jgi:uncharacterized protein
VQYLLPIGSANTKQKNGWTPLHVASRNGCLSIVQHLLSTATDSVDTRDICGNTALHRAGVGGHLHVLQRLIEAGAIVETGTKFGDTAFHFASEHGHLELVAHLHAMLSVLQTSLDRLRCIRPVQRVTWKLSSI